ncbi:MAG: malto-oligosyltrehalose synthase, partial [Actinomycetota bacterium]|nr:malto-oligosyltrehalose synthase [Actinomycetota bacterium]
MTDRVATYRWQLTPDQGFAAAAAAVPDLVALGISHLYLSPIAEAVPGSTHGYDVTDPTSIREELGGPAAFEELAVACREAGIGLVVDIVPNHLAAHERNPMWWDVLRLGSASRYASVFDIDWTVTDPLLLPLLGDHIGRELEAGRIVLQRSTRADRLVVIGYHDRAFPLRPESEGAILAAVARATDDDVLGVAARLLARGEGLVLPDERDADLGVATRTALARLADPATAAALDAELAAINADPDRLQLVLDHQHHRLARWTMGDAELGYRRFFDVDALAATRIDDPATFELLHALPIELVARGLVEGLRIDHVDGLADPAGYLQQLRDLVGPDAWLVVEKIVRRDEDLPPWPVHGTTGYEVADLLGGWLTDPAGAAVLQRGWATRTGEERSYQELALEARREVLASGFVADLARVVERLRAVCAQRRRHRDHTAEDLRATITELAVHTDRYRTYPQPDGDRLSVSDDDRAVILASRDAAAAAAPDLDPELPALLADLLLGRYEGPAEVEVAIRFGQLTGPVAAKGEEDTALYRWLPLPHRCEVGTDPSTSTTPAEWHQACEAAQERWPQRLTALSTHDTKRSADARARLAALTTEPDRLLDTFDRWVKALGADDGAVDPGSAWLTFHALVAAWPLDADRAWTAVSKSVREAGLRTSWVAPDDAFEDQLRALVDDALTSPEAQGLLDDLVAASADAADRAALAQLLAQLLAPGVPDVYQGGEGWDRTLVDPDNRRPPDPDVRRRLVEAARATGPVEAWSDAEARASGLPRAIVLHRALAMRRRHAE